MMKRDVKNVSTVGQDPHHFPTTKSDLSTNSLHERYNIRSNIWTMMYKIRNIIYSANLQPSLSSCIISNAICQLTSNQKSNNFNIINRNSINCNAETFFHFFLCDTYEYYYQRNKSCSTLMRSTGGQLTLLKLTGWSFLQYVPDILTWVIERAGNQHQLHFSNKWSTNHRCFYMHTLNCTKTHCTNSPLCT